MDRSIDQIYEEAVRELASASDKNAIQALSTRYLGRKGIVTQFLRNISNLPAEDRPEIGQSTNRVKKTLDAKFRDALKDIETPSDVIHDRIDVSLPGRPAQRGSIHPVTQVSRQICDIFTRLGFDVAEGPEVETDWYNFESLNFPKDHPARDMQDTFLFQTASS